VIDILHISEEEIMWAKLQSLKVYDTRIIWQFWNGMEYCIGMHPVRCLGDSKESSARLIADNLDIVEDILRKITWAKMPLVRKEELTHLKTANMGSTSLTPGGIKNLIVINTNRELIRISKEDL